MKWNFSVLLIMGMASASFAAPSPRLIQVGPGKAKWMQMSEIEALSKKSHEEGHCGGFMDVTRFASLRQQQGWTMPSKENNGTVALLKNREPQFQDEVDPLLEELSSKNLFGTVEKLSSFKNRFYKSAEGVKSMNWIYDQFEEYANGRSDVHVKLIDHPEFKQPSVVATIDGEGDLAKEIIVIGGHGDSVNWDSGYPDGTEHAPGADDNASGTSTVIEIFRVLTESGFRPKRTLQFMIYAGEELGLLGSQGIAEGYRKNKQQVVAVMQFDMTQYAGSGKKMFFITDNTSKKLNEFTKMLADEYVKIPWSTTSCGYACSDHASWTQAGYAATFPFEAAKDDMNSKIHSTQDVIKNKMDFDFGLEFARLGLSFAVELSLE